jgi:hypothetical protein
VCIISGIARGCGWQHIGAYVNLGAFYLCGIPVAATLGFRTQLRGRGLWIGIQIGASVQTILLCIITSCTNWEKQVSLALFSHDAFDLSLVQDFHLLYLVAKMFGLKKKKSWDYLTIIVIINQNYNILDCYML